MIVINQQRRVSKLELESSKDPSKLIKNTFDSINGEFTINGEILDGIEDMEFRKIEKDSDIIISRKLYLVSEKEMDYLNRNNKPKENKEDEGTTDNTRDSKTS